MCANVAASWNHKFRQAGRDRLVEEMKATLRSLTRAIVDHRDAITGGQREETTADRMLWVRLDLLPHFYDDRTAGPMDRALPAERDAPATGHHALPPPFSHTTEHTP